MNRLSFLRKPRAIALLVLSSLTPVTVTAKSTAPKLVLQITVDQLRSDMPGRLLDRMGDGGFRYLYEQGVVFADAQHAHANTETIVGHATLATGAHPSAHGMVGNVWFDYGLNRLVYNLEDERYPLLGEGTDVDKKTELDPTQKVAKVSGRSPANILASTFSDELALHTAGKAKIFGVSVKDRGAITMAGHAGKAFWFSKQAGEFVTSHFYYDANPPWVFAWNAKRAIKRYAGTSWELLQDQESYLHGAEDDQEWEIALPGYGRTFPHPFGKEESSIFTTLLTLSPAGDELTLDFAKSLIDHEKIGQDEVTDYLSVSFSSTDYIGHFFGPSSLESEDNLLHLDRTLAALLKHVDEKVGLDRTLIVFSADHGAAEVPGYLNQFGIEAKNVAPKTWDKGPGMTALKKRFGIAEELIQTYFHPYIYLNHEAIEARELDLAEVQAAVAAELQKFPAIAMAAASSALTQGELPDTDLTRSIAKNHNARRSGDVYVVFQPHSLTSDLEGTMVACTHGSPWRYDTHVPVIFAGAGIKPREVFRQIHTVDVAPTLAAWLGTKQPSCTAGKILGEVVEQRKR